MAETKQKATPFSDGSATSMSSVLQMINAAFTLPELPVTAFPPPLVMVGGSMRPGLSAKQMSGEIISRQPKAKAPAGDIWGDGENVMEGLISIICEEVVYALQNQAVVNVVVPPGIQLSAVGAGNYGAPVVSQGYTTQYKAANGIIR